jgi:hypothetical protein
MTIGSVIVPSVFRGCRDYRTASSSRHSQSLVASRFAVTAHRAGLPATLNSRLTTNASSFHGIPRYRQPAIGLRRSPPRDEDLLDLSFDTATTLTEIRGESPRLQS